MSVIVYGIKKPPACIYYDSQTGETKTCRCLMENDCCCLHDEETKKKLFSARWSEQYALCPLKELSPHGRLIDADELYNKFRNEYCNKNCDKSVQGKICSHCGVPRAFNLIQNAPTVIEAEVSS